MSVYTRVDDRDLAALLADYALRLEHAQAARHGIENSTFLIEARNLSCCRNRTVHSLR